jgi:hypothetical protein
MPTNEEINKVINEQFNVTVESEDQDLLGLEIEPFELCFALGEAFGFSDLIDGDELADDAYIADVYLFVNNHL